MNLVTMNRRARRATGRSQDSLATALAHHQAGRLAEAEAGYRQVLAAEPRQADGLHLLGLLQHQQGRHAAAIAMIGRAIAIDPRAAVYHANLGAALKDMGRLAEAVASYRRAIALNPGHAQAHNNLGAALKQQGSLAEAVAAYRQACALQPAFVEAQANLGTALAEQGLLAEAATCYRTAIRLRPGHVNAHGNLGNVLAAQGLLVEASEAYATALRLDPGFAAGHNNLGNLFARREMHAAAARCYREAIRLAPDYPDAHSNLGNVLAELDQLDEAVGAYDAAIRLQPGFAAAHNNRGTALQRLGRRGEAIGCYRQAVALRPDYADAHKNLGMALLAEGEMAEGWRAFEWRWQTPGLAPLRRDFAQPQWRGEPAAGRTLLIHAEQGFGDTLQFCRYAVQAAARGLRVVMELPQPLLRLAGSLAGVAQLVPCGAALPQFDLHCPMLSLPLALGTDGAGIPAAGGYLRADATQAAGWRERLAALGTGPRVGLAWAGSAALAADRRRSLAPALLAPVLAVPGLRFVSLQKDQALPGLVDFMGEMADFADTAALVANLDLVVCVDTAMAHLAGALGRPVWMLNRFDSDWRWCAGDADSDWYPSLRQYRQPVPGDWETPLAAVAQDLRRLGADGG